MGVCVKLKFFGFIVLFVIGYFGVTEFLWNQVDKAPVKKAIVHTGFGYPTIADMKNGQTKWTVPWALYFDTEKRCWLTLDQLTSKPGGSCLLEITRKNDTFSAVNHATEYHWEIADERSEGQWVQITDFR